MIRVTVFIDGAWLYSCIRYLRMRFGDKDFKLGYGQLIRVLARRLGDALKERIGHEVLVDVVCVRFFGIAPRNYHPDDEPVAKGINDFHSTIEGELHFGMHVQHVDFGGRRIRAAERTDDSFDPTDAFWTDVDLALELYDLASRDVFDVAICVLGSQDFVPALKRIRKMGRRVLIATVPSRCASVYLDPSDPEGVRDFDTIALDELDPADIRLEVRRYRVRCESPKHTGPRDVWASFQPPTGMPYYCESCRKKFQEDEERLRIDERVDALRALDQSALDPGEEYAVVKRVFADRGFGFVTSVRKADYWFHRNMLRGGLVLEELREGAVVRFEVDCHPGGGRNNGQAKTVLPAAVDIDEVLNKTAEDTAEADE